MDVLALASDNREDRNGNRSNHSEALGAAPAAALYVTTTYGIPCSPKTLAKLVGTGGGPAYRKAGAIPLYAKADLDRWASSKLGPLVRSSAELAEAA